MVIKEFVAIQVRTDLKVLQDYQETKVPLVNKDLLAHKVLKDQLDQLE